MAALFDSGQTGPKFPEVAMTLHSKPESWIDTSGAGISRDSSGAKDSAGEKASVLHRDHPRGIPNGLAAGSEARMVGGPSGVAKVPGSMAGGQFDTSAVGVTRDQPRDGSSGEASRGGAGAIGADLAVERARETLAEQQLLELNHRMANVLQAVLAGIQRQRRLQDAAVARDELERMELQIQATASLQRHLIEPGRHAYVDLQRLLVEIANDIEGITGLVCHVDAEPVSLPGSIATHLATGVVELVWNAYKHGYCSAAGGLVRIQCRRGSGRQLQLSVTDGGQGISPAFDVQGSTGLGLSIVRAVADRFGGTLSVDAGQVTCFTLRLPFAHLRQ